jgi:hypothetical protein
MVQSQGTDRPRLGFGPQIPRSIPRLQGFDAPGILATISSIKPINDAVFDTNVLNIYPDIGSNPVYVDKFGMAVKHDHDNEVAAVSYIYTNILRCKKLTSLTLD